MVLSLMFYPQPRTGATSMRRRKFITFLGSAGAAAAWPLGVHAQQPAMPVMGFLSSASPETFTKRLAAFRQGLNEGGYIPGQNLAAEERWSGSQSDRLPALAADLVHRQAAVIVAHGDLAAFAARATTTTVPIAFLTGTDPVRTGL